MLVFLRFLCAAVAIFATTLYLSSLLTSVSSNSLRFPGAADQEDDTLKAKFRIVAGLVMAVGWGLLFVL